MPWTPTGEIVLAGPVAAFNVITLEHAEAIVDGATEAGQAVILQVSENAVRFHSGHLGPIAVACRAVADGASVPVGLHLDHVVSTGLMLATARYGFGSLMVDASRLSYVDNVTATRAAVEFGHAHGLWVEAELGTVGGKEGDDPHAPGQRTDPEVAASYVEQTGVDALAVAVGSRHAMTTTDAVLDHELIRMLHHAVAVPLVLHGSSGVGEDDLRRAVAGGIRKVNVGTALNVGYTGTLRRMLAEQPRLVDPRAFLAPAREAMAATVARYCRLLASV